MSADRRLFMLGNHLNLEDSEFQMEQTSGKCPRTSRPETKGSKKPPARVCVTGAAGQIAYSLLPMICTGQMLGPNQPIILHLLDIPPMLEALQGVIMELEDGAFPLLVGTLATADPREAFRNADIAIMLGAFPRKAGMERKDLLEKNVGIFKEQGTALNQVASKGVKVLVVGNPANTNALILKHYAPSIPSQNFSALTRLDHNRAVGQIAAKVSKITGTQISPDQVKNVAIWGNHSATQYPDVNHGFVRMPNDGLVLTIRDAVRDDSYLNGEFIQTVQQRGAAVIKARKLSSALSAARAVVNHMHDWMLGTREGEFVSMAVISEGPAAASYGVPPGLVYSFPVMCKAGEWKIVEGLRIDGFSREKMDITSKELLEERESALSCVSKL